MANEFVIFNDKNRLFWSNEQGWVDPKSATRFTQEERDTLNLPMDGRWVPDGDHVVTNWTDPDDEPIKETTEVQLLVTVRYDPAVTDAEMIAAELETKMPPCINGIEQMLQTEVVAETRADQGLNFDAVVSWFGLVRMVGHSAGSAATLHPRLVAFKRRYGDFPHSAWCVDMLHKVLSSPFPEEAAKARSGLVSHVREVLADHDRESQAAVEQAARE